MPAADGSTRQHIIDTAYSLFYQRGFGRVGVDSVAEHAGLTKRTLYYHFASKDELLAAVLEHHGALAIERIQRWGGQLHGTVADLTDALFRELAAWAAKPGWEGAGFTRIVMELADLPGHPARAIARRHKAALEDWLAGEFERRGASSPAQLARGVAILIEGCIAPVLVHGDAS